MVRMDMGRPLLARDMHIQDPAVLMRLQCLATLKSWQQLGALLGCEHYTPVTLDKMCLLWAM